MAAALAAVIVITGLFSTAVRIACLVVMVIVAALAWRAARARDEGRWWLWLVGGSVLSIAGALISLAAETLGGFIALIGGAMVLIGAILGLALTAGAGDAG